ncbi:hypothetical protein LTR84_002762 [Exophiala bonariae]|uniref:Uncharacterized protein n=1 Tax=Exophiala bonariae TaxID=1690606 RepID=A0AAV9N8U1_9EURO|nr:hypothetical protein LTR84_002762 [Exophiala bonariae]
MASKYAAVHVSPKGPGDARPTALQIIQDEDLEGKLSDKVILITGVSSGIGVETTRGLFATGAQLYLAARDLNKAQNALPELVESDRVHFLELDLNSLESVRACAKSFLSRSKTLNIFIANAGVMACPEGRTKDGFETQLGTNHLAHFLLFYLLQPTLLSSATSSSSSRAIFLSSVAHRIAEVNFDNINLEGIYNEWIAYGQSKTAPVWTANEIDRRYGTKGLHATSVNPGAIWTDLQRHMEDQSMFEGLQEYFKSPAQGAATTVWAAVAPLFNNQGGKYLESCQIAKAWTESDGQWGDGYAAWAYDEAKEGKLWKVSLDLLGLKHDTS